MRRTSVVPRGARAAAVVVACLVAAVAGETASSPGAPGGARGVASAGEPADGSDRASVSGRVRSRVAEATDPGTSERRRDELTAVLADEPGPALAKALRESLLSSARRPRALDLAVRLRVPGLFACAKRHADGPGGAAVPELALLDPDPAARAWVLARWLRCDPASAAFRDADAALRRCPAPLEVVDGIASALAEGPRAGAALEVLRFQLAVEDAVPTDLRARWTEARDRFVHESRVHLYAGRDLSGSDGWKLRGARRVGANLRIPGGSCIDLPALPRGAGGEDGVLRLAVAAPAEGAAVVVATEDGSQQLRLRCDRESWFLVEGPPREGERVTAPFVAGAWATVEFRVRDARLPKEPLARDVRVTVDGRELRPSGGFWRLASPLRSLSVVASPGDAPTLAGGFRWEACPR